MNDFPAFVRHAWGAEAGFLFAFIFGVRRKKALAPLIFMVSV
jgi:hypothetical protein